MNLLSFLFLDFDGVINSDNYFNSSRFKKDLIKFRLLSRKNYQMPSRQIAMTVPRIHLDPKAIQLVNQLVSRTNARVIISSTWRGMFTLPYINAMLKSRGATFIIDAATPQSRFFNHVRSPPRGSDIQAYLDSLNKKPKSFVILDDHDDMKHLVNRLILTDERTGITQQNVDSAVEMLR